MRALGIIPARGGSKGVKNKNIRQIAGEPLIAYAIRSAQESHSLTFFLTTTDSDEIALVAQNYGSPVLMRPSELARDDTPMVPVVLHALQYAEKKVGESYEIVVLLQPTAPIRTGEDIDAVIQILRKDKTVDSIVSVSPIEDMHPGRMYRLDAEGWMEPLWSEWEIAQRQVLPVVYYRNGAIYATRRSVLIEKNTIIGERKKAYIIPRTHLLNIDDERDLIIADLLVELWKEGRL